MTDTKQLEEAIAEVRKNKNHDYYKIINDLFGSRVDLILDAAERSILLEKQISWVKWEDAKEDSGLLTTIKVLNDKIKKLTEENEKLKSACKEILQFDELEDYIYDILRKALNADNL